MSKNYQLHQQETRVALTPHDSTDFSDAIRAIYVGGAGDIVIVNEDDTTATLVGVLAGTLLPVAPKRINATAQRQLTL